VRVGSSDSTQPHGASGNENCPPLFRARKKSDKPMVATITDYTTDEQHGQGPRRAAGGRHDPQRFSARPGRPGRPRPRLGFALAGRLGFAPCSLPPGFALARCARFAPGSKGPGLPLARPLGLPLSRGRGRPVRPRSRLPSALSMAAASGPPWPFLGPPMAVRGYAPPVPLDTIRNNSSRYNALGRRHPHPPIYSVAAVRPAVAFRHGRVLSGWARPWRLGFSRRFRARFHQK
jgi:hypothetical protein